jgi:hypothetical protein
MLLSGLLTCTMLLGVVSLRKNSLKINFGDKLEGPLAGIIVRNWAYTKPWRTNRPLNL